MSRPAEEREDRYRPHVSFSGVTVSAGRRGRLVTRGSGGSSLNGRREGRSGQTARYWDTASRPYTFRRQASEAAMNPSSHDRIAHLTEEARARCARELAQSRRRSRLQTAVPVLLLGAWVLSAGAPASQDDLEQRVSELEARLLKGPGTTTRIQAPFEVVGRGRERDPPGDPDDAHVSNGVGIFTKDRTPASSSTTGARHRGAGHRGRTARAGSSTSAISMGSREPRSGPRTA